MPPPETDLVVGISSNVLEAAGPLSRPDGIGVYTRELEAALVANGVCVRRIGSPVRVGYRFAWPQHGSTAFRLPLPWLAAASTLTRRPLPFAEAARGIDVYHATDRVVPRLERTPVVATMYDAIPMAHPEWANARLRHVKNWLLRDWARHADVIIAISEAAIPELVEHYGIAPDRIRVVPLGVNDRWFERPAESAIAPVLSKYDLYAGYFLHVGTLQPRKNLDALIDAYERLPADVRDERQLVLVGKYGWGAAALRARLEALRPARRIVWLDYVTPDELLALYAAAGVFVFPSLAEGFGLPLLEALAMGLPAIASDLPALTEVAGGHAIHVSPHDVDALGDAMAQAHVCSGDENARERRRSYARRFRWSTCARLTLDIYRSVRA